MDQRKWLFELAAILLFAAALGSVASRCWLLQRTPDNPHHSERTAFCDFQDVVYFPTRAAMAGVNPYDARPAEAGGEYHSQFPAGNSFPLYAPLVFVASLPLAILELTTAELLYWILNAGLLVLLSYLLLRVASLRVTTGAICGLAAALLLSRPGHANFHFGAISLPLVLATLGVWWLADRRPWLSAVLFAVACVKPTFGGPLFVLLLLRGSYRAALGGLAMAVVANALTMAAFLPHFLDTKNLFELLANNQAVVESDPAVDPLLSASRVDLLMVVERLLGRHLPGVLRMGITFAVLIVAGLGIRRMQNSTTADDDRRRLDSLAVALLTVAICIYHNIYDALLVAPAAVVVWSRLKDCATASERRRHWFVLICLLVPAVNYFSSSRFLSLLGELAPPIAGLVKQPALWTMLCVLNGLCLAAAWCLLVVGCFRDRQNLTQLQPSK